MSGGPGRVSWSFAPRASAARHQTRVPGGYLRQLTGLDAQFLALETPRQSGHFSGLVILDPSTRPNGRLELADVQNMIPERLPLLPPFRWRLKEVPLRLDYPYWIDDPDFDLEYHVRALTLPPPPTDAKLAEQVARIFARPLDRARPLWELYLIHGLKRRQHRAADEGPPRGRRTKGDQGARYLYSFISDEALASIGGRVKTLRGRRTTDVWLSKSVRTAAPRLRSRCESGPSTHLCYSRMEASMCQQPTTVRRPLVR